MRKLFILLYLISLSGCGPNIAETPPPGTAGAIVYSLLEAISHRQINLDSCLPDQKYACSSSSNSCSSSSDPYDIGHSCASALDAGEVGDKCSGLPTEKSIVGSLDKEDVDLILVTLRDRASLFCDFFGDSFLPVVSLFSAPPGVVLCVRPESSATCTEHSRHFDNSYCRSTRWTQPGSYGSNNSVRLSIWVMWHPQAPQQCSPYKMIIRAKTS